MKNKIMLVASPGGHFVQLSLVAEYMAQHHLIIVSTYENKPSFIVGNEYFKISDVNRKNFLKTFVLLKQCIALLLKTKPDLIITTGAAPGLIVAVLSKLLGKKTVWLDSIANSRKLSLSGSIAKKFKITVLSQWKDVALRDNVKYKGRLM